MSAQREARRVLRTWLAWKNRVASGHGFASEDADDFATQAEAVRRDGWLAGGPAVLVDDSQ